MILQARRCNLSRSSDRYLGRESWNTSHAYSATGERGEGRGERGEGRGEREEGRGEKGEGRGERGRVQINIARVNPVHGEWSDHYTTEAP